MSTVPFQNVSNAVFGAKYQLKSKLQHLVDSDRHGTYCRVAKALSVNEERSDYWAEQFLWAMENGAVPAGRILSNAGAKEHKPKTTLINCILSDTVRDSIGGIGGAVANSMISLSTGAGVGYEFSTLRPRGSYVNGVGSETSGPLPFMDIFDKSCSTVSSAGGRRGAQMATFDLRHPDVLDFVVAKQENGRFRQFNLSVLVPDSFMEDLAEIKRGIPTESWKLRFPLRETDPDFDDATCVYDWWHVNDPAYVKIGDGKTLFKVYKEIAQDDLWKSVMESAYNFSEPGIMFVDHINRENNLWFAEHLSSSNPCSEIYLPPNGSCLLGSINLTSFIQKPFTSEAFFDWDTFKKVVRIFTRMLDNVVEVSSLPLPAQRDEIFSKRRHGMGIMGLGSALIMLGMTYGLEASTNFTTKVMKTLTYEGYDVGADLAKEKGEAPILKQEFTITPDLCRYHNPFAQVHVGENFSGRELWLQSGFMRRVVNEFPELGEKLARHGCRFSHHSAIAPTGTISLAMGNNISNGCEPSFAHEYTRNLTVGNKKTRQQERVYSYEALLYRKIFNLAEDAELPSLFVTADSLHWKQHLAVLAAAQIWTDAGISKCVDGSTLVPTNYGLRRMDSLSLESHTVHDSFKEPLLNLKVLCPDGKLRKVTNHYFGGTKPCRKIRFNNGYELTASLVHKVMTPFGWRCYGDLQVGDSVLFSSSVTEYEGVDGQSLPEAPITGHYSKDIVIPTQVTEDFALFVGMWLADGSLVESNGAINFTNSTDFVIDRYVELVVDLFSVRPRVQFDKRSDKNLRTVTFASKRCCGWLKSLCGHKAGGKKVPDQIITGSKNELLALLRGLSLDGCNLNNATCVYDGKSKILAQQVFEICFVLGLEPHFGKKWVSTHDYFTYGVRIYGFSGCLEARKNSSGFHERFLPIPEEVYSMPFDSKHPQRVTLGKIRRGAQISGSIKESTLIKLGIAYNPAIFSVMITDVEDVIAEVYDITVDESHDYLLGGLWSHNTINLPTDTTFEEFKDVYVHAYKLNCKSVSVFRYNPDTLGSILTLDSDLKNTRYRFVLESGETLEVSGDQKVEYDGEVTVAANLFSALKEGTYAKF